ncbi:MAG: YafY family transcriptional regulator [Actinobacteria bacterium]|nr:YafY family transcriptional regulator [Actinomycetota bacterium]
MNRTDRLYAIVEELRAVSPRPRSASWLARRFEVSPRTIERDIAALQQAGAPVYAEPGRLGGYAVHRHATLPPRHVTPAEVTALAVALTEFRGPFAAEARAALTKLVGTMPAGQADAARELIGRVRLLSREPVPATPWLPVVEAAVVQRRAVRLSYLDKHGEASQREVEPGSLVGSAGNWYLVGWCRLRGAARVFRLDRIRRATLTAERVPVRGFEELVPDHGSVPTRALSLG